MEKKSDALRWSAVKPTVNTAVQMLMRFQCRSCVFVKVEQLQDLVSDHKCDQSGSHSLAFHFIWIHLS